MTDDELLVRARAGDSAAFGELVERHHGPVFRAALAALGSPAEAEDVAQEAMLLAFKRLEQFRGEASVRTWMVSIAWRLSLSRRRTLAWRLKSLVAGQFEFDGLRSGTRSPEAVMVGAEMMDKIRRHIKRLPRRLRDALLLTAAGDLTQDEIAAALKIPASTFRGRLREARIVLKRKLEQEQ
jgi:RNA polymerase sigma-70 factor (ECF subfamily)